MGQRFPVWASSASAGLAATALAAWSCWQRWQLLASSPFPLGVDGYFYPLQLRALLAHGQLAYPTSPLAFYLLAPFAAATDPITGAKLGAAVFGAAIALPSYGLGARLGGCRGAGLVAAVLATTSVGSMYLTIEFVKNGLGLAVALAALWLILRATDAPSPRRLGLAVAGCAAAWATHKMAAALVVVVAVPAVLAAARAPRAARPRRSVVALATCAVLAVAAGLCFPQRVLAPGDAALLGGLWSRTPRWTAPALALPTGALALGHDALLGLGLGLTAVIAAATRRVRSRRRHIPDAPDSSAIPDAPGSSAIPDAPGSSAIPDAPGSSAIPDAPDSSAIPDAPGSSAIPDAPGSSAIPDAPGSSAIPDAPGSSAIPDAPGSSAIPDAPGSSAIPDAPPSPATTHASPSPTATAGWSILVMAIAIGLPFLAVTDRQGLGFRLRVAAFVPAALAAAVVARELIGRYRHRDAVLTALAVALVFVRQPSEPVGEIVTHPALVTAAQALDGHVPRDTTLIIPERHLVFLVAWYTGAPTALRPDGIAPERRMRLLPLHFIGAGSPLDRALTAARAEPSLRAPLGVHPRHPNGLILVDEATWRWVLDRLPPGDRAHFAAWPTI